LPASTDAFVWLRLYQLELAERIPKGRRQPLWWTLRRPARPLSYHAVHRMFERAGAAVGSTATLHGLRHTAAYRMAEDPDLPLTDVQFVLGHALLTTTQLYQCIRNIQLRLLPEDELLPIEVSKYDQKMVLEALHNCIAHQDYTLHGRVVVIEQSDRLVFENEGNFYEGTPDDYLEGNRTPHRYRNPFLVQAMSELNMIDTMGYGIHDMYARQARRYFPMPDYDLAEPSSVRLTIYGGVVDPAYSRLLIQKTDLPLADVLALDRVQKKLPIPDEAISRLRRAGLIEGRKPNLLVSATVGKVTADKIDYIRTRPQDDEFYAKLLTDYLEKFGQASRAEINQLLLDKLSDALSEKQKFTKISTLLTKLRRRALIENTGSDTAPCWQLTKRISSTAKK
jgi:ATP-dependent DNA helicase RecG